MYSKSTSRRARIRRISLGAIVDVFNFIEQFKALSGVFSFKRMLGSSRFKFHN